MAEARRFRPPFTQIPAYNCSPSFNWQAKLDAPAMKRWREELAALGYRFNSSLWRVGML
jgi:isocitrate lyase